MQIVRQVFFELLTPSQDLRVLFSDIEYRKEMFCELYDCSCLDSFDHLFQKPLRAELLALILSQYTDNVATLIHESLTDGAPIDKLKSLFEANALSFVQLDRKKSLMESSIGTTIDVMELDAGIFRIIKRDVSTKELVIKKVIVDQPLLLTCQGINIKTNSDSATFEALKNGAFPNLKIIKVEANSEEELVDLPSISKCNHIIITCPGIHKILPKISQTVLTLTLCDCGLSDDSIRLLKPCMANIEELDLSKNKITSLKTITDLLFSDHVELQNFGNYPYAVSPSVGSVNGMKKKDLSRPNTYARKGKPHLDGKCTLFVYKPTSNGSVIVPDTYYKDTPSSAPSLLRILNLSENPLKKESLSSISFMTATFFPNLIEYYVSLPSDTEMSTVYSCLDLMFTCPEFKRMHLTTDRLFTNAELEEIANKVESTKAASSKKQVLFFNQHQNNIKLRAVCDKKKPKIFLRPYYDDDA